MGRNLFLGLLVVMFAVTSASAAPIGRAKTIGQGKYLVEQVNDFIFEKDIKTKTSSDSGTYAGVNVVFKDDAGATIASVTNLNATWTESQTIKPDLDNVIVNGLGGTYGLADNLDVFVRLGVSNGKLKGGSYTTTMTGTAADLTIAGTSYGAIAVTETLDITSKIKLKSGFNYAVGLKHTIPLSDGWIPGAGEGWIFGADALFRGFNNKFKADYSYTLSGDVSASDSSSENGKGSMNEWQFAPYLAKEMGDFVPYFGVKYSDVRIKTKMGGEKETYEADKNVGVFLGTDFTPDESENFALNLEVRFIDEMAMAFSASYKF